MSSSCTGGDSSWILEKPIHRKSGNALERTAELVKPLPLGVLKKKVNVVLSGMI